MLIRFICLLALLSQIQSLDGRLMTSGTSVFTIVTATKTLKVETSCFISSNVVTQCQQKRGIQEVPQIFQSEIDPSTVLPSEKTAFAFGHETKSLDLSETIVSSFDDNFHNSLDLSPLAVNRRNYFITFGNCGHSTLSLMQLFSCLGLDIAPETTTWTATFTETATAVNYVTLVVEGCTPVHFPYDLCTVNNDAPAYPIDYKTCIQDNMPEEVCAFLFPH